MNRRHALNFSMVLLLCAALFGVPFAHASLSGLNDTCINTFDASNSPVCNTRTVWDILSSCGLTLFACTWTAVHMNIPYMNHNKWDITGRRLLLMVLALIAPEAITTLAAWELLNACKVADKFNDFNGIKHDKWWITLLGYIRRLNPINCCRRRSKSSNSLCNVWTVRHGFFAYMGGFVLHVNGQPRATLTPKELLEFVQSGSVKMPDITEADIEDRSKGDLLSKIAAIFQLLWFVIQIIARHAKNLPVTLLEIDTLAIAVVACISYLLWLKKPKDVGRPYIVHWNSEATAPPSDSPNLCDKHYSTPPQIQGFFSEVLYIRFPDSSLAKIPTAFGSASGMVFGAIHCLGWNFFPGHTKQILWRVASIGVPCSLMVPFLGAAVFLSQDYVNNLGDAHELLMGSLVRALRRGVEVAMGLQRAQDRVEVPTCLKRAWEKVPSWLRRIILAFLIAIKFVITTVVRFVAIVIGIVLIVVGIIYSLGLAIALAGAVFGIFVGTFVGVICFIFLYLFARFTIFVLMFLSLRSLPPGAYRTVVWSEFIPHL